MPAPGTVAWADLTVPDAESLKDFYAAAVGWTPVPLDMGGYADYCMTPPGSDTPAAGVCHARGPNADLPPVWLVYFAVPDLAKSLTEVTARGGTILRPMASCGGTLIAVIRDPAGAVCALSQAAG